jgi:hypothetical protein
MCPPSRPEVRSSRLWKTWGVRPFFWTVLLLFAPGLNQRAVAVEAEYYGDLVSMATPVFGMVKKGGHLPVTYASRSFPSDLALECLTKKKHEHIDADSRPCPMAKKCAIFVNHQYKFIFIRNRKSASTSLLQVCLLHPYSFLVYPN